MKHKLLMIVAAFALVINSSAQITIPNGGFESWVTGSAYNPVLPAGWHDAGFSSGVTKSSVAHGGSFAVKLAVVPFFTGITAADISDHFRIPSITTAPLYYTFWAKVHLSGTDKFYINADLTQSPSPTIYTDIPYGMGTLTTANNTTVWQQFSYALETSTPAHACDSVSLRFYFYPRLDTASYVIIDDIAFANSVAGIQEINDNSTIEAAYPNPAGSSTSVVYSIRETAIVTMDVYDVLGNKIKNAVSENQSAGKYKADIDTDDLANGIYFVQLFVNGRQHSEKIIVQH
jgi:hypothetical protein